MIHKTVWGQEPSDVNAAVGKAVVDEYRRLEQSRRDVEDIWYMAWALYLNTNQARDAVRARISQVIGDVESDWRHKINRGKAFSQVETVHSYMMAAQFPSRRWFNTKPTNPEHKMEAKAVTEYVAKMLDRYDYTTKHDIALRQLLITGTTVMGLPYRYDTVKERYRRRVEIPDIDTDGTINGTTVSYVKEEGATIQVGAPDFEVVNTFDVYLDPQYSDPNDPRGVFIRKVRKRRGEVARLMKQGHYNHNMTSLLHSKAVHTVNGAERLKEYEGIQVNHGFSMYDEVELMEYWGDLHLDGATYHDVMALVLMDGTVLKFSANPYWAGRPYVVGQYVPTVNQPYSIGLLQPSLGLLTTADNMLNHRLDAVELSIDPMYEVAADAGIDDDELFSQPGKVFRTTNGNGIRPIPTGDKAYTITYNEVQVLDNHINENSGTPSLVSSGQVRAGERVTAQEIQAIKDSGGNRLSGVFARIETTFVYTILKKVFKLLQQFADESLTVQIDTDGNGTIAFVEVDPADLTSAYELHPLGSNHVIEREQFIDQRVQLLTIASQVDGMMERLNIDAILEDIVGALGFDDPDRYLQGSTPVPVPQNSISAPLTPQEELQEMGGQGFADAMAVQGNGNPSLGVQQLLG